MSSGITNFRLVLIFAFQIACTIQDNPVPNIIGEDFLQLVSLIYGRWTLFLGKLYSQVFSVSQALFGTFPSCAPVPFFHISCYSLVTIVVSASPLLFSCVMYTVWDTHSLHRIPVPYSPCLLSLISSVCEQLVVT